MGTKETHKTNRQRLRKKLRARGVPESEIERILAAKQQRQRYSRDQGTAPRVVPIDMILNDRAMEERRRRETSEGRAHLARLEAETYARFNPDDKSHRPKPADPLTTGRGPRATGQTAKAVKRGKTVTRFEYDQAEGS